jgi:dUTP pyrophosphatase
MSEYQQGGVVPQGSPWVKIGNMIAKVRRGPGSAAPVRQYDGDAGFDLAYAGKEPVDVLPGQTAQLPCALAIQWPPGVWGFIVGRSSTFNDGLLVNPSVIDWGWRGDLYVAVRNLSTITPTTIHPGRRLAQIVPLPVVADSIEMFEVAALDPHPRGTNGFGSSGR